MTAAIAAAVILTYANSLSGPFVFDDRGTILDNHTIESLASPAVLAAPFESPAAGRPLVNLSFAINYAIGGRDITGYHVGNIAIHLACALVLFGIVRRATNHPYVAFAAALLWAVHPLTSEPVNYLTQRTESLMALCFFLTMYCAVRGLEPGRHGRWEALAAVACAAGMASKETMVVAPVMVALYDRLVHFASWQDAWRHRRRLYGLLAATWLLLAVLVSSAPRSLSAGFTAPDADVWNYLLNQAVLIPHYFWLVLWPQALSIYYGWPVPQTLAGIWPQALLMAGLLGLTAVACWRRPKIGFLLLWVWLTLAPTSSILPIATEVGAERRMYLAMAALMTLAVAGWRVLHHRRRLAPLVTGAVFAALAVSLSARTIARNREYRSTLQLAETTLARWPTSAAHSMLGVELANLGRFEEAERHLRLAAADYSPARYYLATVLDHEGQKAAAISYYRAFIAEQPPELDQVRLARSLLAGIYVEQQRWGEAAEQYRAILAAAPDDVDAHALLADALVRQNAFDEAIRHYEQYLSLEPDNVMAVSGLAIALSAVGRIDEGLDAFRRAVALAPNQSRLHQNLARALADAGRIDEARSEAAEAVRLAPNDPAAISLFDALKKYPERQ